jgi:hypothetical protein
MNRYQPVRIDPKTNAQNDTGNPARPKPRGMYRASLEESGSSAISKRSASSGYLRPRRLGHALAAAFTAATWAFFAFGADIPANVTAGVSEPVAPASAAALPAPAARLSPIEALAEE